MFTKITIEQMYEHRLGNQFCKNYNQLSAVELVENLDTGDTRENIDQAHSISNSNYQDGLN
jgi:hypothetical protein